MKFQKRRNYAVEMKNTRLRLRLDKSDFARLINIKADHVGLIEVGEVEPDRDVLRDMKWLKLFGACLARSIYTKRKIRLVFLLIFSPGFRFLRYRYWRIIGRVDRRGQFRLSL